MKKLCFFTRLTLTAFLLAALLVFTACGEETKKDESSNGTPAAESAELSADTAQESSEEAQESIESAEESAETVFVNVYTVVGSSMAGEILSGDSSVSAEYIMGRLTKDSKLYSVLKERNPNANTDLAPYMTGGTAFEDMPLADYSRVNEDDFFVRVGTENLTPTTENAPMSLIIEVADPEGVDEEAIIKLFEDCGICTDGWFTLSLYDSKRAYEEFCAKEGPYVDGNSGSERRPEDDFIHDKAVHDACPYTYFTVYATEAQLDALKTEVETASDTFKITALPGFCVNVEAGHLSEEGTHSGKALFYSMVEYGIIYNY